MIDYSTWAEKRVAVVSLQLDPENPRIPLSGDGATLEQRDLISELVTNDDVLDLAKKIADKGYSPVESLIGWKNDAGETIILEGNRRLAALKVLLSPEAAPKDFEKRARAIAKNINQDAIKMVRVLYAPNRLAAAHLIMQRHTTTQIEKWSPLMQARFFLRLVESGLTPDEIASEHGGSASEISDSIRLYEVYQIARRVTLPAAIKDVVNNPREFEISTLERLVKTKVAREALGFDYDGVKVIGRVVKAEFEKGLARVLTDIVVNKKDVNTRTLNSVDQMKSYLAKIKKDLPKTKGSFTANDFLSPAEKKTADASRAPAKKKPPSKKVTPGLVPPGVSCTVDNHRIQAVFKELKALKLDKHPNSSAILFRIVLELGLGHYLEKTGRMKELNDAAKAKGKHDYYPTLSQMLAHFLKEPDLPLDTLAKRKVNTMLSSSDSPYTIERLDQYVHNKYAWPEVGSLRSHWDTFDGLIRLVLQEPSHRPPPKKGS